MALQFSTAVLNARLNAIESTTGAAALLKLYTGTPPATCATADAGTLLATITLPSTWLGSASGGVVAIAGTWLGTAAVTGTIGHFRIQDPTGATTHIQGTVGTTGTDMIVSPSASLTAGQPFTVTTFTITDPNS